MKGRLPSLPFFYIQRKDTNSMASIAQIAANRDNAKHSTGPKSAEGKARAARNNLRHGFRSLSVLLPGEDPAAYDALLAELQEHFAPGDLTENCAVREMADAEWRLRRARLHQEILLTAKIEELQAANPAADPILLQAQAHDLLLRDSPYFAQLLRYESKFERQYDRAYRSWFSYQDARDRKRRRDVETEWRACLSAPLPTLESAPKNETDEPNSTPTPSSQTPRNASCPCGSGLKYKRCCGKNAAPLLFPSAPAR